ncbi:hypothetical protein CDD81_4830 [Ophiocordyceps australis]|uniref:Glucose receptor Git3-like N-terminal domain-containing protein n=1 Tax=Ophiocordyceps australis TaxID=1399860 RepID=A0A2C5Y922_9HYPO|nr:hypothetical protein CDD81_4830 [Ophiocordyceps australis]
MSQYEPPDLAIAVPTFIGSLLSFIATSIAITLHLLSPPKRHFRHALIINLLVADFINSLNNTVSGAVVLSRGNQPESLAPDAACLANAWLGQFSVQAVDFNILIISIVVLYTVLNSRIITESSTITTVGICALAWLPGLITSCIALGTHIFGHVSGNWCWIRSEFLGMRYGLTHGWRIAIFVATIAIYTFIYIHLKRQFGRFRVSAPSTGTTTTRDQGFIDDGTGDTQHILVSNTFAVSHELEERHPQSHEPITPSEPSPPSKAAFVSVAAVEDENDPSSSSSSSLQQQNKHAHFRPLPPRPEPVRRTAPKLPAPPNLKRMLLMNGYPIAYIILWLPGIINRLTESLGTSPRWLRALQSSTQFIGFVNACSYGFSEHLRRASRQWMKRRGFLRAGG